jgi:hypothetical protein
MGRVAGQWSAAVLIGLAMLLGCPRGAVAKAIARPVIAAEAADCAHDLQSDQQVPAPAFWRLQAQDTEVIRWRTPTTLAADRAFVSVPSPHRKVLPRGTSDDPPSH